MSEDVIAKYEAAKAAFYAGKKLNFIVEADVAVAFLRAENERLMAERDEARVDARTARRLISATHKNAVKHENCETPHCNICEGGLFVCADCGAAEIETEECICPAAEAREAKAVEDMRERAAKVADVRAAMAGKITQEAAWAVLESLPDAIRALPTEVQNAD